MAISYETGRYIRDICQEVAREIAEPKRLKGKDQIGGENLADALGNMASAADEYAKAMKSLTPEAFAENPDDAVQAVAEQLRALTKLALRAKSA